jgi:hypothetical protein
VGEELNVPQMILQEQLLCPYHLRVQNLMPVDFPTRESFCQCFVQGSAEFSFLSSVLFFTNEALLVELASSIFTTETREQRIFLTV